MTRWTMLLDLGRCTGCDACTIACKNENRTPPGVQLAPVYRKEEGHYPTAKVVFLPTLCMHCENPPCMRACPSAAISKRPDGIVVVDEDKCCGSRACVTACPYGAMHFYDEPAPRFGTAADSALDTVLNGAHQPGTALKCNFCAHRIDQGITTPACVETCHAGARIFGDMDDPQSQVSQLLRQRNAIALRPEAGTQPTVRYLP